MSTFFESLAAAGRRWNVLEHPFYTRWERGELTRDELGYYAGEYRHAVTALADAAQTAAATCEAALEPVLRAHAAEERDHVELWDDFARAFEADLGRPPRPETRECVEAWTAGGTSLEALSILLAIESAQPQISSTKLAGLTEHYGVRAEDAGGRYFALHAELDHEHAAQSRGILAERVAEEDAGRLVELAQRALRGNWRLLDGVETARAA